MSYHRQSYCTGDSIQQRATVSDLHRSDPTKSAFPAPTMDCWQLWLDHQAHFYGLCRQWLNNNQSDIDDAFNRAALLVWQKRHKLAQTLANPMAWLTGLVRHICLDLHRAHQRTATRTVALDGVEEIAAPSHRLPAHDSPEIIYLRREKYAYISQAIEALPPQLRTVIILRFYQEQSCEEIAERLQLSVDNVYKRIQEARIRLLHKLQTYQRGLDGPDPDTSPLDEAHWQATLPPTPTDSDAVEPLQPRVAVLPQISKREEQKLRTLRAYVTQHPTGWKKRLELADQLCKMNELAEALGMYKQVLEKQPQLVSVWMQVGRLYAELDRDEDAFVAYKRALSLVVIPAERATLTALIGKMAVYGSTQKSKNSEMR